MKKWLVVEIIILVVLCAVAVAVLMGWPQNTFAPQPLQDNTAETSETTEETSEPEPTWMSFPADRVLTAQQAFVYDCDLNQFIYINEEETDRIYPASITKLFTAHVALQFLQPEQLITAGDVLDMVGVGSSVAEIEKGNILSVEMLVEAMLLPSGNDASYILADAAGKAIKKDDTLTPAAAVDAFIAEMNGQARALGMTGTQFKNPDGYHEYDHYTNYRDLVTIAKLSMENEIIMKYAKVSKETAVFESGETKQWENTNKLIDPTSAYYCAYATGLKTGQTPSAGSCLLSTVDVKGKCLIIGVFGCPEIEDRFEDTLQLLSETLSIN